MTPAPRARRRRATWAAVVVVALALLTLASARGGDPALYPPRPGQGVTVFVVDDGFHSDIAVPTAAIEAHGAALAEAARRTSKQPWMLIGWGDARFYEASSSALSRVPDGVAALIGGRPTVVHLQGIRDRPDKIWDTGVRALPLSRPGLAALLARADRALVRDAGGAPVIAAPRHDPEEGFFASRERFSLTHLCNHWTAELLNAAGLPVTPVLDTLPAGLALDLRLRAGL